MAVVSPLVEQRAVAPMMKNGYILACPNTRLAAYIDPGDEADELLEFVEAEGLTLTGILNTHGHMDHICGNRRVKEKWGVPIYLHPDDEFLYSALRKQAEWFGFRYDDAPPVDRYLKPGEDVGVGDLRVAVHHTPGHSPGSVSLQVDSYVFCGDLIFAGSVGRTDLPGGTPQLLLKTIREKILPLDENTILYPGHGPPTTVGRERSTNPFLNGEF
jgi:hydroxyacylglutathione hydrolase